MKSIQLTVLSSILLASVGCQHLANRPVEVHSLVQVCPKTNFHGVTIFALFGDDTASLGDGVCFSNGSVIDLPTSDTPKVSIQFAIANGFRDDIHLKVSTRVDSGDADLPHVTVADISASEAAALVADRDTPYLWLRGTDGTGISPPGFRSDGMTWGVKGASFEIPAKTSLHFRRILVLDFYNQAQGKHYLIEYPFECTFRRG